jgi:hypothetical protein
VTAIRRLLLDSRLRGYEMPDWYPLIRTARYYNVPPWELLDAPEIWYHLGRAAQNAEHGAANARSNNPK